MFNIDMLFVIKCTKIWRYSGSIIMEIVQKRNRGGRSKLGFAIV